MSQAVIGIVPDFVAADQLVRDLAHHKNRRAISAYKVIDWYAENFATYIVAQCSLTELIEGAHLVWLNKGRLPCSNVGYIYRTIHLASLLIN